MRLPRFLAAACLLWGRFCFGGYVGPAPSYVVLHGLLRDAKSSSPVPGAMITLFDAQNTLVDFTYTTTDGAFTFRTPLTAGKYFIEASHQNASREFVYDSSAPPGTFLLMAKPSSRFASLVKGAVSKLDGLIGALIGLAAGFAFSQWTKKWQDSRLFSNQIAYLVDQRNRVAETWKQIEAVVKQAEGISSSDLKRIALETRYRELLVELGSKIEDYQREKLDPSLIRSVKHNEGLTQARELEKTVDKLAKFSSGPAALPPNGTGFPDAQAVFNSFQQSPLLNS
jgi:hypothetical protein